ncbi:SAM-dependent methyltransferase [Candidatus Tisiphia endosymbiont of Nemotelus uliginosus]|uniref:SAM-dependent methyltransferase n=1 Tax=Candidatus Tisiphia endosymbiont of Nemotelus uliginosus TaxID=3077926 RepID=UPI0035C8A168
MFGSRAIVSIFSTLKEKLKLCYQGITNFPSWYQRKVLIIINYFVDVKYKVAHIKETNLNLGLEHLYKNNLNDAILRFKLVEKFLAPQDPEANYWLGWTYFLKNNHTKAVSHLQKSCKADQVKLGLFLQNYQNLSEIPQQIWRQYRNLIAQHYINKFYSNNKLHLPYIFVSKIINTIPSLPDTYSVLELGSNVGVIGYEVKKRFPDHFTITGVESAKAMSQLISLYYSNLNIYDQLIETSIPNFLEQHPDKYDVILSCNSLAFTKDLTKYFTLISSITRELGYFAFCLPIDQTSSFSIARKEFISTIEEINSALNQVKFIILSNEELELEKNSKYYMVVCKKNN